MGVGGVHNALLLTRFVLSEGFYISCYSYISFAILYTYVHIKVI